LGISESTSSTARDARERFHSCHQGNAGELEWERSRAFCFPHFLNFLKAVQCADLTMTGSIGFDIGSDFSHCPSIRNNA
jgi:hypothetical protein